MCNIDRSTAVALPMLHLVLNRGHMKAISCVLLCSLSHVISHIQLLYWPRLNSYSSHLLL